MTRVVLAGFGGIGTQDHLTDMYLPAFTAHPAFTLVGAVDVSGTDGPAKAAAAKAASAHGLRHFTDLDEAVAAADVVCVAAPLHARAAVIETAVRAGRHVLADKPMAATLAETEAIARLAADRGVVVVPAHHIRLGGALRSARAAVCGGRIGLPWNVQADLIVAGGDPAPTGELVNLALYPIDAVLALLDLAVHRVHAVGDATLVTLLLTHANEVTSTIVCGRTSALHGVAPAGIAVHRYRVSGTHGVLVIDATKPGLRVRTAAGQTTAWTGPGTVDALLDVLAVGVRTGRAEFDAWDAVRVRRIIGAAERSLDTGRPVDLGSDD